MNSLEDDDSVLEADGNKQQSDIEWSDLESISTSTSRRTSVASSLYSDLTEYIYENGRRYHALSKGVYNLPNDEKEQERLDIIHYQMLIILDGELHLCPLSNPRRILDVGTGTGIWAIDMADLYETTEIIGTDLSPIQPHWVPPNCRFEIGDAEGEWCFTKESFDMIHVRSLNFSIKDWPRFLEQIYDHLVPEGWVELNELELKAQTDGGMLPEECAIRKVVDSTNEALRKMGIDTSLAPKMRELERQGFVDIQELRYKLPWGPWPSDQKLKKIGKCSLFLATASGSDSHLLAMFTRVLGWPAEEANELIRKMMEEANTQKYRIYMEGTILIGRKPWVGEVADEKEWKKEKEVGEVGERGF